MRPPRPWTVLPHEPVIDLETNLRVVSGRLPRGNIPRRMTVARLQDGRLLFHNAVPLEEPAMKSLEAWGEPAFLFVPNGWHRLDVHAFKARYPALKVLCPREVRARVAEKVQVDGDTFDFPRDPGVELIPLRGTKTGEAALQVRSGGKSSLAFGDVLMNLRSLPGFEGLVFRLLGSVGGPRVTRIARRVVVKDKALLRQHFEELATLPGLSRLIPSHGDVVDVDAPEVLRGVARAL